MEFYLQLILTATFQGIGTAAGLYAFEQYVKPNIDRIKTAHQKVKEARNKVKDYFKEVRAKKDIIINTLSDKP